MSRSSIPGVESSVALAKKVTHHRNWRWFADSSGVAFLERTPNGNQRLFLADLRKKTVEPLTSTMETVTAFDIRDRQHYVYVVADPTERKKWESRNVRHQLLWVLGVPL